MKERPILFSGAMIRALLAGTKTQTRRAVKGWPLEWLATGQFTPEYVADPANRACPYGQPGDQLWVRETFAKIDGQTQPWIETDYRATYTHGDRLGDTLGIKKRWTPAIHMPRSASRISLEVTGVRVERLQDISEADAIAEGIGLEGGMFTNGDGLEYDLPIQAYSALWESINGPGSWAANPWVWAVKFKRQQQETQV